MTKALYDIVYGNADSVNCGKIVFHHARKQALRSSDFAADKPPKNWRISEKMEGPEGT